MVLDGNRMAHGGCPRAEAPPDVEEDPKSTIELKLRLFIPIIPGIFYFESAIGLAGDDRL